MRSSMLPRGLVRFQLCMAKNSPPHLSPLPLAGGEGRVRGKLMAAGRSANLARQFMTALVPFVMVVVLGLCTARSAYADSAVVLPKGYGFLNLEDRYFLPTTQRYDQNGNTVSIGSDFSQNLTSNI